MKQVVDHFLNEATLGQLAIKIAERLPSHTEIKIKPGTVRVQHNMHCDRLISARTIDEALGLRRASPGIAI